MGVKLQSSSGGSVEIAAPVTASNYVLTAPAKTATLLTTASTGTVLQVVNSTTATTVSSSSATFADTTLTASITPLSASNKILVIVHQNGVRKTASSANANMAIRLLRDATEIHRFAQFSLYTSITMEVRGQTLSTSYLDSPGTTSQIIYKTQFASADGAAQVVVQNESSLSVSTITLMEIAG